MASPWRVTGKDRTVRSIALWHINSLTARQVGCALCWGQAGRTSRRWRRCCCRCRPAACLRQDVACVRDTDPGVDRFDAANVNPHCLADFEGFALRQCGPQFAILAGVSLIVHMNAVDQRQKTSGVVVVEADPRRFCLLDTVYVWGVGHTEGQVKGRCACDSCCAPHTFIAWDFHHQKVWALRSLVEGRELDCQVVRPSNEVRYVGLCDPTEPVARNRIAV
mmetsp:Transcript_82230/g.232719  ORF Transcript_82230/g.232719 Transcript_82230/m.232719 type:complete len:221 (+) Transcript_82230:144-806(+)